MTQATQRAHLVAETIRLERLISTLHPDSILERMARHVAPSNLPERDQADQAWLAYARKEAEIDFAAIDRGEGIRGSVGEHMARIAATVRARVAQRAGK
jgi:hypothetical protein